MTAEAGQTSTKNCIVNNKLNNDSSNISDRTIGYISRQSAVLTGDCKGSADSVNTTTAGLPLEQFRRVETVQEAQQSSNSHSGSGSHPCQSESGPQLLPSLPTADCVLADRYQNFPLFNTLKFSGRNRLSVINPVLNVTSIMDNLQEAHAVPPPTADESPTDNSGRNCSNVPDVLPPDSQLEQQQTSIGDSAMETETIDSSSDSTNTVVSVDNNMSTNASSAQDSSSNAPSSRATKPPISNPYRRSGRGHAHPVQLTKSSSKSTQASVGSTTPSVNDDSRNNPLAGNRFAVLQDDTPSSPATASKPSVNGAGVKFAQD